MRRLLVLQVSTPDWETADISTVCEYPIDEINAAMAHKRMLEEEGLSDHERIIVEVYE